MPISLRWNVHRAVKRADLVNVLGDVGQVLQHQHGRVVGNLCNRVLVHVGIAQMRGLVDEHFQEVEPLEVGIDRKLLTVVVSGGPCVALPPPYDAVQPASYPMASL